LRCSGGETHLGFSVVYFSGLGDEPTQLGRPAVQHPALVFHVLALGVIVVAASDRRQRLAVSVQRRWVLWQVYFKLEVATPAGVTLTYRPGHFWS
jgi:hypothetical protein